MAGADQTDRALKRLQRDLRAAPAESEAEPAALAGLSKRHREVGLEVPAEGAHHDRGVGALGGGEGDVAVVGGEGVPPTVPDGTVISEVAVHGGGVEARGVDLLEHHVSVDGFGGDL